ncbi:MAG: class I SAM-dependent methyltransferase [Anaerolineaceae bacterium]|nr:class I SAM-dependent methyltransferase [Anaerolineaceae bacterium]
MNKKIELPDIQLESASNWQEYHLLDSGNGKTLERFGPYILIRPEPQVIWKQSLSKEVWKSAHATMQEAQAEFGGQWHTLKPIDKSWQMKYKTLSFQVQLASSRHIGVFPEQASHWDWIEKQVNQAGRPLKVLNLFGYTGLATLAATRSGAEVTHVDSSKHALSWANHNMALSGMKEKPVRWIAEDALKFVQREVRRGNLYDGVILDPPKFGRGSDGNVWDFYKNLPDMLLACRDVLSTKAVFIVLTAYAIQASSVIPYQAMLEIVNGRKGKITSGELVTIEESGGHIISHALFSRWTSQE